MVIEKNEGGCGSNAPTSLASAVRCWHQRGGQQSTVGSEWRRSICRSGDVQRGSFVAVFATPRACFACGEHLRVPRKGKTLKSYFFGVQRVATRIVDDSSWQTTPLASLMWESPVEVAMEWAQNPIVVVSLNETAQTAVLSTLGVLFVALFLMPAGRRRRAVVGMRVSRAPALMLVLLFTTGTMPLPLLIQPAQACTGGSCPTPTPTPAENLRYFHYDHLGSPIMISDGDGEVSEHIRYNPYGEVRARFDKNRIAIGEPGPDDIRYEFTGYEAERNSGLLYANARFYDPDLGSFTSHDQRTSFGARIRMLDGIRSI